MRALLVALLIAAPMQGSLREDPIESLSLASDFHSNEVAAEATYKGKRLFIAGPVDQVSISGDDAVLSLAGSVACYVAKPWPKSLQRIVVDQRVLIRGKVLGIPFVHSIMVQPCALVSEHANP